MTKCLGNLMIHDDTNACSYRDYAPEHILQRCGYTSRARVVSYRIYRERTTRHLCATLLAMPANRELRQISGDDDSKLFDT
jgi:hypothetical protein